MLRTTLLQKAGGLGLVLGDAVLSGTTLTSGTGGPALWLMGGLTLAGLLYAAREAADAVFRED